MVKVDMQKHWESMPNPLSKIFDFESCLAPLIFSIIESSQISMEKKIILLKHWMFLQVS